MEATIISGGSRISPEGGVHQPQGGGGGVPTYCLTNFSGKLHENEKNLAGGHASLAPPLDLPLISPAHVVREGTVFAGVCVCVSTGGEGCPLASGPRWGGGRVWGTLVTSSPQPWPGQGYPPKARNRAPPPPPPRQHTPWTGCGHVGGLPCLLFCAHRHRYPCPCHSFKFSMWAKQNTQGVKPLKHGKN